MSAQRDVQNRSDTDEVCPVCKTSSYLNKNLRFLVNPECYHRMCESCVDRIFSQGPAQCPIAGCKRTLRKHRFRRQTFEDLTIEREVDIRKRVMLILNRREEEFETKRDWDDFLEQREEIVTNLVMGTDVAATEAQLAEYAAANETSIKANATLERQASDGFKRLQAEEEILARMRKEASRQAYEDERKEKIQEKANALDQIAAGQYEETSGRARSKTTGGHPSMKNGKAPTPSTGGLKIKGIKLGLPLGAQVEKQYDPFMGMKITRDYYTLQNDYPSARLGKAKGDTRILAGGYDFSTFYDESLLKAFAGLGCFIEDEVKERDATTSKELARSVAAHT